MSFAIVKKKGKRTRQSRAAQAIAALMRRQKRRLLPYPVMPRPLPLRTGGYANIPEVKYIDVSISSVVSNVGAAVLLNGCTPGSGATNRIGRKITMISCHVKLYIKQNTSDNSNWTGVKIALVYDKQTNATALSWSDVYDTSSVIADRNLDNRDRFIVLWDSKAIGFDAYGSAKNVHTENVFIKRRLDVIFNSGSAGTVADIQTGSLHLLHYTDETTNVPSMGCQTRVKFVDN